MIQFQTIRPEHLLIAPLLIPFLAGALMLLYDDRRRWLKLGVGMVSGVAMLLVSIKLLNQAEADASMRLYLLGNWPMPMGIVLVVDRLSALMVMLTALLAIPAMIYASAGWQGKGQHYHSLFQFLLFGLNGAFLTGDLFNLFVFFEVMLASSYGLMLHGSGPDRIKAGLHYIAINLAASLLFLIGIALIYGTTGTLNMAELSRISPTLEDDLRPLFHMGAAMLGLAFLVKAAIWPLCFWLPRTYAVASPPAAAIMAIMSKVGVYAILRLAMLNFAPGMGVSAGFGGPVLILLGLATMLYALFGILSAQGLAWKAGYATLISSGTVISVVGFALTGGGEGMLAAALYYMVGSTVAVSALFLLAEPLERAGRTTEEDPGDGDEEASTIPSLEVLDWWGPMGLGSVEDDDAPATTLPASVTALAMCFIVLVGFVAGLPPFSGFIGKVGIISGMLEETARADGAISSLVWLFMAVLFASGLASLIALMRFGIRRFWVTPREGTPILALEIAPVGLLLAMLTLLTVQAQPSLRFTSATAATLLTPPAYAQSVLTSAPLRDDDEEPPPDRGRVPFPSVGGHSGLTPATGAGEVPE
ncbi:MAG: monovalent cation/H+ antiporter subunit D [Paracoccus sp. (in: a-proteobacteria)]|uniref:monovalent cation/H+ antiporter subunit D n=1 Tax=Paracoccus sp. TaxID=267 RepID=UPI0026DEF4DA|nr:monovalent cation/H+ antiporter subunit D [Paracoccus sp. (in: a-proteobacteria)]MDO5613399.1 monovalent cation/H+ antiporter subunit D [Paracoccus sp. (in: a-proteobacteria)]